MYQILSQSVRFCRLYIKKNFGSQCIVTVRTNDLFERPGTGALVVIRQVLVRQQLHIDRLVQAFHRVMEMHLRLT